MTEVAQAVERAGQLRALLDSQDRLIGSVAHELRTPLSAVVGLSSELRDRAGSMPVEELVALSTIIAEQSTSIAAVIEDLLAMARIRGPGLTVNVVDVDLLGEVRLAASSLGVVDRLPITGTGTAHADPRRVQHVIRNLLSNAFRYGGPSVSVTIEVHDTAAVVEVIDDGPGIDPERVEQIFEDFERSHDDPGRPGSLGLGLTVSRGLARLMNGEVDYQRKENLTRFKVTLPLPPQAAEEVPELVDRSRSITDRSRSITDIGPEENEKFRELVYQSRANTDIGPVEIEEILTVSRRNNLRSGLSGLLVYHEGDFLQVLEGPPDDVERVFDVIRNDPRHYRVNVIVDHEVSRRSFGNWEMGFREIDHHIDDEEGMSDFLSGAELPPASDRYIQMIFESFRDGRSG